MNSIICRTVIAFAATAAAAAPAYAQTATNNLAVSATVTENCVVSAAPLAFGDVDVTLGSAVNLATSLSVTCTSGTAWSANADEGDGVGATHAVRKMSGTGGTLNYALYSDAGYSQVWGDASGETEEAMIAGEGIGTSQQSSIYGRILAGQSGVQAGSYTDSVVITVTY